MTIAYEHIYIYHAADQRLRRQQYHNQWSTKYSRDGDSMTKFTLYKVAKADSQNNWNWCMAVARKQRAQIMVLSPNKVQFLGGERYGTVQSDLMPSDWSHKFIQWNDTVHWGHSQALHTEDTSTLEQILLFRRCLALKAEVGVWDVLTGQRINGRDRIIELFWHHGFATQRGAPLSVCNPRNAGSRHDLEELTKLAEYHRYRKHSQVSQKIWSAYKSIARTAIWPGCLD